MWCYILVVMLTKDDKREMKEMVFEGVLEALEQVVLPRLHNIEEDVREIKEDIVVMKENVSQLNQKAETLDNDMGGVKMRLASMEKKMDERTDTYFVVKDHEKRIRRLEGVSN